MAIPVVDQDTCIGCGLCTQLAPKTFELNEDAVAQVVDPEGDDEATIQQAIDGCPVAAISWSES
ncbi:MAG: ferredoxin [Armatimonadia bacterium]